MTTHRAIQVSELLDKVMIKANCHRRAASNLARVNNQRGALIYTVKAEKCDRIAYACRLRIAEDDRQRSMHHLNCKCAFFHVKDNRYRCHYCGYEMWHDHSPLCNGSFPGVLTCAFADR
jgi:hypothetical protein